MIRVNLVTERKPGKAAAPVAMSSGGGGGGQLGFYLLLFLFVGGAGAAVAFGWWWISSQISGLEREIKGLEDRQKSLQAIKKQVEELEAKRKQYQQQAELITKLKKDQSLPVHMLDEISRALPDFVWLNGMDQRDVTVNFDGEASNNTAIAEFMVGLQSRGDANCAKQGPSDRPAERTLCWFPKVDFVDSKRLPNGAFSFKISGTVSNAEAAAEAARLGATTTPAPPAGAPPTTLPASR